MFGIVVRFCAFACFNAASAAKATGTNSFPEQFAVKRGLAIPGAMGCSLWSTWLCENVTAGTLEQGPPLLFCRCARAGS